MGACEDPPLSRRTAGELAHCRGDLLEAEHIGTGPRRDPALLGLPTRLALALIAALMVWLVAEAGSAGAASYGSRPLKVGVRGGDVKKLQFFLTKLDVPTGVDGVFGRRTRKSVKRLEKRRDWKIDGRVPRKQAPKIKRAAARVTTGTPRSRLHHVFPIRGPHNYGGSQSRFGAPRGDHRHQGQDIFANCGTPLVAALGGRVDVRAYQAGGAGYYVVIDGDGTRKDYVYMHLRDPASVARGSHVDTGQLIGYVGHTGSASGCHLHFERWTAPGWYEGGHPFDPLPALRYWDSYS